jgi:hypothetical protein
MGWPEATALMVTVGMLMGMVPLTIWIIERRG